MMTVYFFFTGSTEGATYTTALQNVDLIKLLKDVYCMVMLARRCWHHSVEILKDENGLKEAARLLRRRYGFRGSRKPISGAQAIKLS